MTDTVLVSVEDAPLASVTPQTETIVSIIAESIIPSTSVEVSPQTEINLTTESVVVELTLSLEEMTTVYVSVLPATAEVSLIIESGTQGPQGVPGPSGVGSRWYHGAGIPSDLLGTDNDYYLDKITGDVYVKEGGTWL